MKNEVFNLKLNTRSNAFACSNTLRNELCSYAKENKPNQSNRIDGQWRKEVMDNDQA